MKPMLATTSAGIPPAGEQWVHEIKWDGMRVLAQVQGGEVTLSARSGNDATVRFPEFAVLGELFDDLLLDGEVVALVGGRPNFSALAERMHVSVAAQAARLASAAPLTFVVFDVLRVLGQSVLDQPWSARRALLEQLDLGAGPGEGRILVPPVHPDGDALLAATKEQGLEGIVSKRRSAPYQPGRRSPDWVKTAHRPTISAMVAGWRPEEGSSDKLGAVLLGVPSSDPRTDPQAPWHYLGRAGSGLAGALGAQLREQLRDLSTTSAGNPFVSTGPYPIPASDARGAHWVAPGMVVDVDALGGYPIPGKRLRQPSVQRERPDLGIVQIWQAWQSAKEEHDGA